jgi:hypothetical protein
MKSPDTATMRPRIELAHTSSDGVRYTRMTRGGSSVCYISGTVNFVPGILHDSSKPTKTNCPPEDSGWMKN